MGFGILTVCAATALSLLTPVSRRGKAVGAYGLAASVPQLVFASSAPILAEYLSDRVVLASGALPLIGLLWIAPLGGRLTTLEAAHNERPDGALRSQRYVFGLIWPALLALLIVTSTGGAVLTFARQIAVNSQAATAALFALTACAVVARWLAGAMSDKRGTGMMIPTLVAVTGGAALILSGSLIVSEPANLALLVFGAAVLGGAYGGLQSATLVRAFEDSGAGNASRVSLLWNITFDFGMGAGALGVGAIAQSSSFVVALACMAGLSVMGVVVTSTKTRLARTS